MEYHAAWAALGILSYLQYKKLIEVFGSLKKAWQKINIKNLKHIGITEKIAKKITEFKKHIDPEAEIKKLYNKKIEILFIEDKDYPLLLKETSDPPVFLYAQGNKEIISGLNFAVVGTRKMSFYGKENAYTFSYKLAEAGLTIISGMALGIDSVSHKAALDAKGKTIAVLGCGIDINYPSSNIGLKNEIIKTGLIISEYPLGTDPFPYNFPKRNRIIAGLSLGTLVVEGNVYSGSLITARFALEENRDVFAIPGSVHLTGCQGTNHIITRGEAKLVSSPKDILKELDINRLNCYKEKKETFLKDKTQKKIFNILGIEEKTTDQIIEESSLPPMEVSSHLTVMEIRGLVKNIGGKWFKQF